jgi:hypothetical protein
MAEKSAHRNPKIDLELTSEYAVLMTLAAPKNGHQHLTCFGGRRTIPERMPQKRPTRRKMSRKETRNLDVKIKFMEGIVKGDPGYVEALQILGDYYTQRGRFQQGLAVDEQLCRLEPHNPIVFYNLACSYSLTGLTEQAARALEQSIALGYRDFTWLAKDPDLNALRQDPIFRDLEDRIRRMIIPIS